MAYRARGRLQPKYTTSKYHRAVCTERGAGCAQQAPLTGTVADSTGAATGLGAAATGLGAGLFGWAVRPTSPAAQWMRTTSISMCLPKRRDGI